MNIRSITLGINWQDKSKIDTEDTTRSFLRVANEYFEREGVHVRTNRLTLPPINSYVRSSRASVNSIVRWVSQLCEQVDIRWFCVPFSSFEADDPRERYATAIEIANRYKNAFINLIVAENGTINSSGIADAGRFIRSVSRLSNNGFDNFRVGASCNCPPNTPFFPFSFHSGRDGFSLALEITHRLISLIGEAKGYGLEEVREGLMKEMTQGLRHIDAIGREIENKTAIEFKGIDASLAPFPDGENSVGRIIELLGVEEVGSNGTLFFTSFLTDVIQSAIRDSEILSVGFNGVMFSLLEDDYLAKTNNYKNLTIDSLLSYSSVCGCGLDMVPVPGDIFEEEIASLILDVAALSSTLKKPLGVRILPIPMKTANEHTAFNYDFLVDTRVLGIKNRVGIKPPSIDAVFHYLS